MKSVLILGGGLAGWSLFEHLVSLGYAPEQLALIEKGMSARGASGVLQGMLHPFTGRTLYPKAGAMDAWAYSKQWLHQMQARSDESIYTPSALWRIAMDDKTTEQFDRSFVRASQSLVDYPVQTLEDVTPLQGVKSAYVLPEAGHVNLQRLLAYFQRTYAASCYAHQRVQSLSCQNGVWHLKTDQYTLQAPQVVLAVGHELLDFFPHLPLRTKRGEVICFTHTQRIPACVSGGGRYLVPLQQGTPDAEGRFTYIGGATFYADRGLWPPTQAWKDLCERFHWFPDIEQGQVKRVWSGVRATLHPDREPLCGPVPDQPGLWLMSAFSTRGLLQIPRHVRALAHQLTETKTEQTPTLPVESLPERLLHFKFLRKAGIEPFSRGPILASPTKYCAPEKQS